MYMNSSKLLFYTTMATGIMISISSDNWLMIWCGMEISLISFIPQMISKSLISSESMMKYFIIQSISSSMLILGLMIMVMKGDYSYDFFLKASILMKTGVAPFHNWVLTVIEGLEPLTTIILLSINKVAPITVMSYFSSTFEVIITLTILAGSILGLNQSSMKKIIGYSSIFNMGFILVAIKYSLMWIMYLTVYSMLLWLILMYTNNNKINFINQTVYSESIISKMSVWMNMLSMGGMPPLIGFSIKYMTIMLMIKSNTLMLNAILIMSSLLVMMFYLRITFISIMNSSLILKKKLFVKNNMSWMLIINVMALPILMMSKTMTV